VELIVSVQDFTGQNGMCLMSCGEHCSLFGRILQCRVGSKKGIDENLKSSGLTFMLCYNNENRYTTAIILYLPHKQ
jgi:hypothetical protein